MEIQKETRQFNIDKNGCLSVEIVEFIEMDGNKTYLQGREQFLSFTPLQLDLAEKFLPDDYYRMYETFCTENVIEKFKESLPEEIA